jgi:OmcA/MtrC family decaheme c-type cytochrome
VACSIANVDGGRALTCGTDVTVIPDPCTIVNDGAGVTTITCPGVAPFTVTQNEPCLVVQDTTAQTATITCPGSDALVIDMATPTLPDGGAAAVTCAVATSADGTRILNCSDGTSTILAPPSTRLTRFETTPGLKLTILTTRRIPTGATAPITGAYAAGDTIVVTYKLEDGAGHPVLLSAIDDARAWFAGPTNNYQHIIPTNATATNKALTDIKATSVDNLDGTYTYAFTAPIPATIPPQLNAVTPLPDDGTLAGSALPDGTYTIVMSASKNYFIDGTAVKDSSNPTVDVLFGAAAALAPRAVVNSDTCNTCHSSIRGHGGRYRGPEVCITCHTSGSREKATFGNQSIDFRVLVHKLHSGIHLPSVNGVTTAATGGALVYGTTPTPYVVEGADFSTVIFPMMPNFQIAMPKHTGYSALSRTLATGQTTPIAQTANDNMRKGITGCGTCHGDPDGAGPLAAPAEGGNAYTETSRRACGSCHDDLNYARAIGTMGANKTEASCAGCHVASGDEYDTITAHTHPMTTAAVDPQNVMAITAVGGMATGATAFQNGDIPTVTFTVKNPAGADIPIGNYDSFTLGFTGPTTARQVVFAGSQTASPFDFTGRAQVLPGATAANGTMGKVFAAGTTASAVLTVNFDSATGYTVNSRVGAASVAIGTGTLAGSTSAANSGTFANFKLSAAVTTRALTVTWAAGGVFTVRDGTTVVGTGTMPNTINAVTRFISDDGSIEFNVTLGTTAPADGAVANLSIFKGSTNPVAFALVAGTRAFAVGDRFYYDYVAPAATYTVNIPSDLTMERLGTTAGTALPAAANLPVYYGRQALYEVTTPATPVTTTLGRANGLLARWFYPTSATGFASGDYVVIEAGTVREEYVALSAVSTANNSFTTGKGLRYAHAAGATIAKVTLTLRREGTDYTLDPATGIITLAAASTNVFVLNYRTHGRFGWRRSNQAVATDPVQYAYYQPADGLEQTDGSWGDWRGKAYVAGTYTVALWGNTNVEFPLTAGGEHQVYRGTTRPSQMDVGYNSPTATAGTLAPYSVMQTTISSTGVVTDPCAACHGDLRFHGGGRRGSYACMVCHATPGAQVNFATLAHEFHAETLPVMPNGAADCASCHGTSNNWSAPNDRTHPAAGSMLSHRWGQSCEGCHTSAPAVAHIESMTVEGGGESCETCHGAGSDFPVAVMHMAR